MEKLRLELEEMRKVNYQLSSQLSRLSLQESVQLENRESQKAIDDLQYNQENLKNTVIQNDEGAGVQDQAASQGSNVSQHSQPLLQPQEMLSKLPIYIRRNLPLKNWNLQRKKVLYSSSRSKIKAIEPANDLNYCITGDKQGSVIIWQFNEGNETTELKTLKIHDAAVKCLLYLNDNKTLLSGGKDGNLFKIDLSIFLYQAIESQGHPIRALVNALNGRSVFGACGRFINEYDIVNRTLAYKVEAHEDDITDLLFHKERNVIVSCSKDRKIKIFNAETKDNLGVLDGHSMAINSICFSIFKNNDYIVSVSKDGYITFWNLTDRNKTLSIKMAQPSARKVFYLHDKKSVCTVHKNGTFDLWNLAKEANRDYIVSDVPFITGCYFDDGKHLLFSRTDGSLEIWNSS